MLRGTDQALIRALTEFRYRLRLFLRFSERAVRGYGITPSQHQLLLGVAGFRAQGMATVSELAEFLQLRHNAVVGLIDRAAARRLVRRARVSRDKRRVTVRLTPSGGALIRRLARLHHAELARLGDGLPFQPPRIRPRARKPHSKLRR